MPALSGPVARILDDLCDLSDLDDVRRFGKAFGDRKLDVLMHNAGVVMTSRRHRFWKIFIFQNLRLNAYVQ